MRNNLIIDTALQNAEQSQFCGGVPADELLTMAEAAPIFKLSLQGAYRAAREKQIPVIFIGRQMRVPRSAIQNWIAEQLQGGMAQKAAA